MQHFSVVSENIYHAFHGNGLNKTSHIKRIKLMALTLWVILFSISSSAIAQTIPAKISYQGKLLENSLPVTGSKNFTFTLLNVGWSETHSNVQVVNGLYSVQLGAINPLPTAIFTNNTTLTLQIQVNGMTLQPATEIVSVAYAFQAEHAESADNLNGQPASAYLNVESINQLHGDSNGNVNITGNAPVTITSQNNTIAVSATETDPTVAAHVKDGVTWSEVTNRPSGLDDGDQTGVAQINYMAGDANGNVTIAAGSNVSVSNANNAITISATPGGGGGDITAVNTNAGSGLSGGATSGDITLSVATGGVATTMLADNAVTTAKIADGAVATGDLAANAVTSDKISDGAIANADVSSSAAIAESKLALTHATHANTNDPTADQKAALAGTNGAPSATNKYVTNSDTRNSDARTPTGAAGGDLTGTYPNPTIANNAVSSAKITDGTIANADIADNTITAAKISPTW